MKSNWLADLFIKQREIIEAAETPFAKLAMFILPVLSPLVPAIMTGMHLYQIFLDIFTFIGSEILSGFLSIVAGFVLELLGYVGAITFIKGIFNYLSTRQTEYLVPMVLNGSAYVFYLGLLWMINYQLGKYLGVDPTLNNIIATLSFVSVPTSLLAGSHLSEKAKEEREEKERVLQAQILKDQQAREDQLRAEQNSLELSKAEQERLYKLERYRVKHGKVPSASLESSNRDGNLLESSKKVPDWRKVLPSLTKEDLVRLAGLTPTTMQQYASETGFTYKTISNWRARAEEELKKMKGENDNK